MGSNFSAELLELIDNRLEYQVMTESERQREMAVVGWIVDDHISLLRNNPV